ncbi:MAG: cation-translocating P-type ATPase [Verrucomicrobiales bacterium]|nr:cation-translocating P-type ATPase [Verrucomicrobiales bacterium]
MGSCCQGSSRSASTVATKVGSVPGASTDRSNGWFSFGLLTFLAGLAMTVTLAVNLEPPPEPTRTWIHGFLALLAGTALLVFGQAIYRGAFRRKITLESLFVVGTLGAYGASLYSTVTGTGHIYYEVVLVLLAIYRLGQLLSGAQLAQSGDLSREIPGLHSRVLTRVGDGWIETEISKIKAGDVVKAKAGDVISVDGIIQRGLCYVEELSHTGEPFPVPKSEGDIVKAGTIALDGDIEILSRVNGTEREIDRLAESLTNTSPSHVEELAQRILDWFVPTVILVSIGTFLVWGVWFGEWDAAIFHSLAVALVACPCGLGLAIPLAARRGRARLYHMGFRLHDANLVERLAGVTTIVFDKTGTLTHSHIALRELQLESNAPVNLSGFLSAVQRRSSHPVARPFWNLDQDTQVEDLDILPIPARGIEATFRFEQQRHSLVIVNDEGLRERGLEKLVEDPCKCDRSSRRLHVLFDREKVATALLEEEQRSMTDHVLSELKALGYSLGVISGDVAIPQGWSSHLDFFATGISSQQKGARICQMEDSGSRVLFVGDGLNDAEAVKEAHASIAMVDASTVTQRLSSASLVHSDLTVILDALKVARETGRRLQRLLYFVLLYNGAGMTLAALGFLHPIAAALLMLGSSITVLRSV